MRSYLAETCQLSLLYLVLYHPACYYYLLLLPCYSPHYFLIILLAPFNIVYFLLDPVFISGSGSSQFLQDIKTLDEKYSLVSSTPSVNLDKRMGKFKTFSESTLLESISETDSECHHRMSEEFNSNNLHKFKDRLSSIGGSTTFSDRDAERSFEHYNHHDSVCMCNNSQCQNNQNSTFIIQKQKYNLIPKKIKTDQV